MERPEKDEIQNWLRHPVGQWFLSELDLHREKNIKALLSEEGNRLYIVQGHGQFMSAIKDILDGR